MPRYADLPFIRTLNVGDKTYNYLSLVAADQAHWINLPLLPFTLRILAENVFRNSSQQAVKMVDPWREWLGHRGRAPSTIYYQPVRILMQDFTGIPTFVDLAAMRDVLAQMGDDPELINPQCPVHLVVDHSIQVDRFGTSDAWAYNNAKDMHRNRERYQFIRWGQQNFEGCTVIPPGGGICHQVNLEHIARVVWHRTLVSGSFACPDTLIGTDSHTTMINGLGVLGWGVGGIEAEAVLLGQPIAMLLPEVVGVRLQGELKEGVTATDLVLTITELLRKQDVVGKFVEFYGPGLSALSVSQRATIANMAPEYGATCGFFPVDEQTIRYLELTCRTPEQLALTEAYCKAQFLWHDVETSSNIVFTDTVELDLADVEPCLAGPKRPQDRVPLKQLKQTVEPLLHGQPKIESSHDEHILTSGDVVIAAITSCTNTSNPSVLIAAGILAKKAVEKGLQRQPWVKSSLAPGSRVVVDYLKATGLLPYLEQLGFNLVGFGCTTCIGNSGPLLLPVQQAIDDHDLWVCAVLSGNRNFEGRIHPQVKGNWLASPPLVVAFALAGTVCTDLTQQPLGHTPEGQPVYLKDIWPSHQEISIEFDKIKASMFERAYCDIEQGDAAWKSLSVNREDCYPWNPQSTYIQKPPFFDAILKDPHPAPIKNIRQARILALLGDSITTDHISPAGNIKLESPAGQYLLAHGVAVEDFNSYGSRRGNHEVLMRGTFANIRIRNRMVDCEGGWTLHHPSGDIMSIYDASMRYQEDNIPLVVIAGQNYGTGSSRDWAAKGPLLLGVKAIIAESYERIHRSNLIGMGILPLQFLEGMNQHTLSLDGDEQFSIDLDTSIKPKAILKVHIKREDREITTIDVRCCIDTLQEATYYKHGGILPYVLYQALSKKYL